MCGLVGEGANPFASQKCRADAERAWTINAFTPTSCATLAVRKMASRSSALPMPWCCQARSTAKRPSSMTGIGSGMFRRIRPGARSLQIEAVARL